MPESQLLHNSFDNIQLIFWDFHPCHCTLYSTYTLPRKQWNGYKSRYTIKRSKGTERLKSYKNLSENCVAICVNTLVDTKRDTRSLIPTQKKKKYSQQKVYKTTAMLTLFLIVLTPIDRPSLPMELKRGKQLTNWNLLAFPVPTSYMWYNSVMRLTLVMSLALPIHQ